MLVAKIILGWYAMTGSRSMKLPFLEKSYGSYWPYLQALLKSKVNVRQTRKIGVAIRKAFLFPA